MGQTRLLFEGVRFGWTCCGCGKNVPGPLVERAEQENPSDPLPAGSGSGEGSAGGSGPVAGVGEKPKEKSETTRLRPEIPGPVSASTK